MTKKITLQKVLTLVDLFKQGKIKTLAQHEVNPGLEKGSRENYLYFTLPVCINFQKNSPAMWRAALATYSDEETRYLFFPEKTIGQEREKVQTDLLKHKLALQKNKHTVILIAISQTLHEYFSDDPREVIKKADYDVSKLLEILQVSQKPNFPFLSGPKLSNYWPYILSKYTDVQFTNTYEISIIPDTHVIQITVKLGLAEEGVSSLEVVKIWKGLLKNSGLNPVEVHPVLWNWSRNNFKPEV